MTNDRKTAIIVAIIGATATIAAAIIGVKWGKNNFEVKATIEGEAIILKKADIKEIANENEDLKNKLSDYESQIGDLKSESESLSKELEDAPVIEYKNCGLSIDGEEKTVDKDKSSVLINGNPYYSKEFVDNLLPSDKSAIQKNDMLYIGKIVKEKSNLFDMKVIRTSNSVGIEESSKDTYGNIYNKTAIFRGLDDGITFNTNREYSKLKCTLAVLDENSGGGIIQIESEKKVLYTSKEITSTTEPFEIDISINNASQITIKQISGGWTCNMIANAVVYNQE